MSRFDHAVPQLHDDLARSAAAHPGKVALVCRGQRLTYAEIHARATALAHALVRRGVRRGDRVMIFAESSIEAAIAFWGVLAANAVVSLAGPQTKADELGYLLADCRARVLVADAHLAPTFVPAARRAHELEAVIAAGAGDVSGAPGPSRWDDALAEAPPGGPPPRENLDVDLAAIVYTSGGAGDPRGVMLTHRNMIAAAASLSACLEVREDDVIHSALPLSFDHGLYQMIMAFRAGARLLLDRSFAFPARSLEAMAEEGVTVFSGAPAMFAALAESRDIPPCDRSRVRCVTSAAALADKHVARIGELFSRARILSTYGLAECGRCAYLPPEDRRRKPGSVGIAVPDTELWVVGEDGARLGPNEVGELVIRGAAVMAGYWEKPEVTARRLAPGPLPGERVLRTGDLCRLDEEGHVTFVGRMDEIIRSCGEDVPPREVERALLAVPGVREAAVVGVPDPILGQAVKAFVVAERGVTLTEQKIVRACRVSLAPFMVPKHVAVVAELPAT